MKKRRGLMMVLSSPSGAGKSTLSRLLLEKEKPVDLSVSVTTRKRRSSEVEGKHYFFISSEQFDHMRQNNALMEWAEVHGNFYGTPRNTVEIALEAGRDVLFDIDWQGTLQLYEKARKDMVSIFILPPSMAELKTRLERRAEDTIDIIKHRLENAREEISHWHEYDYVLINDDLNTTFEQVQSILKAERIRQDRNLQLIDFVEKLMQ